MATSYKVVTRKYGASEVPAYECDIHHTQGDALVIDYTITQSSGNPTVPTAATLKIAPAKGATATVSTAMTVTDNTENYTVAKTVEGSTMDIAAGTYYYQVEETYSSGTPLTKLEGRLYIEEDVG